MRFITSLTAGSLGASLVAAAPLAAKRNSGVTDVDILNYALTLEHLENRFYQEGLQNFTGEQFATAGYDQTFYANLQTISNDERTHVGFLTTALEADGAEAVQECTYDFGVTDVATFLATASILEGVGVSAYLGAAAEIMNKTYLTAAGSILTVEARHSAYLRATLKEKPFPQPFDTPLSLNEVFSLASPFIVSCPDSNPALPVKAFPALALAAGSPMPLQSGNTITLQTPDSMPAQEPQTLYAAFIAVTGPTFVAVTPVDGGYSVMLPEGFAGQTYVVLTSGNEEVTDDTTVAGPALIEISA